MASDIVTIEEVEKNLSSVEKFVKGLGPKDNYLQGILRSANIMAKSQMAVGRPGDGVLLQNIDKGNLPIGYAGTALQNLDRGEKGQALFNINGSKIVLDIKAGSRVENDDTVIINDDNNTVVSDSDTKSAIPHQEFGSSSLGGDNEVKVKPEEYIDVSNEDWTNSSNDISPSISDNTFSSDLTAGDELSPVTVKENASTRGLEIISLGVSSHKADIDSDNKDESVVRYHIEYKRGNNSNWQEMKGPSGVFPIGGVHSPQNLVKGGTISDLEKPIKEFRVRYENRTDEGTYSDTTVPKDDIGTRIVARSVVL